MASLNRAMLIGSLGRDPEVRYTPAGQAVSCFSLAASEKFKGKSGEWEEQTEWHNITLFGKPTRYQTHPAALLFNWLYSKSAGL